MSSLPSSIRAVLLASSPYHAKWGLNPVEAASFADIFGENGRILFIPYALKDRARYATFYRDMFAPLGFTLSSLSDCETQAECERAVNEATGLFIGGGNTFRLLAALQQLGLLEALRTRILSGTPYMGTSAGSTLFCPTIQTTNDMPIVVVRDMRAFGFLPFQINPHYPEIETQGAAESRRDRLMEYLEENETPVLGLREGSLLRVKDGTVTLCGKPAALFRKDQPCREVDAQAFETALTSIQTKS